MLQSFDLHPSKQTIKLMACNEKMHHLVTDAFCKHGVCGSFIAYWCFAVFGYWILDNKPFAMSTVGTFRIVLN